jgi:hypothetical protein
MLFQEMAKGRGRASDLHDAVISADRAKLLDVKGRVGAVLEGKAAFAGHAVAAGVERGALVVLRLVHAKNVTFGMIRT